MPGQWRAWNVCIYCLHGFFVQTSDHDIAAPAGRTAMPLFRWDGSIAIRMLSHIARQSGLQEGDTAGAVFIP